MSLIFNKKATFKYEVLEKMEAGIELFGFEVKSIRGKHGSLDSSYVSVRGNEVFLIGAHIPPYQVNNTPKEYDPYRARKLLLKKTEIQTLIGKEKVKGLTIVPISMYNKGYKIKVEIAITHGKKQHDKRQAIKKREQNREVERLLKNGN